MPKIFTDLRVWTAIVAAIVIALGSALLDHLTASSRDLEDEFRQELARPMEGLPPQLSALLGAMGQAELQASDAGDRVVNPFSGADLVEVHPGVSLPVGLGTDLAAAIAQPDLDAAVAHAVDTAWGAMDDPAGLLTATPGLEEKLRARMEAALWGELAAWGQILQEAPAWGPRPWALVAGLGQSAMGGSVEPQLEGAIYDTWAEVLATEARDRGRPTRLFRLGMPTGTWKKASDTARLAFGLERTWHPDFVPVEDIVAALGRGEEPELDPFAPLGRLRALQLLAEAGRVTLVFGGHGQEIQAVEDAPSRFKSYALDGLSVGEECQELGLLRSRRGGLTIQAGFCLDAGDTLVALSCSNAWASNSGPQHNTATVAWLLTHGSPAPFAVIEPVGFRIFTPLQEGLRDAEAPEDVEEAVRAALFTAGDLLPAGDGRFTEALDMGGEVWLLRTMDASVADLVVVGPEVVDITERQDRRLQLAGTAWNLVIPTKLTQGAPQIREPMRICGGRTDCDRRLDHLDRTLAGTWPTSPNDAVPIGLAGRQHLILADPNTTHAWVRLHVVRAEGESEGDWLARADGVVRSLRSRRVASVTGA